MENDTCRKGHDLSVVGETPKGYCRECVRIANKSNWERNGEKRNRIRNANRAKLSIEEKRVRNQADWARKKVRLKELGLIRYGNQRATQEYRERLRVEDPDKLRTIYRRADLMKYGVTEAQYDAVYRKQGGVCAICGQPETTRRKGTVMRLAIDHDHLTGKFRGLLCNTCNRAIGLAKEDPGFLFAAARYLLAAQAEDVEEIVLREQNTA